MWEHFSLEARNTFFIADAEARRLRGNYISTEHLLLGILYDKECRAARLLSKMGFSGEAILGEVQRRIGGVPGNMPYQPIELTANALSVIEIARSEAKRADREAIGTEHLLLGMLQGQGLAGRVLADIGVDIERVRTESASLWYGEG
jgi:ATP-dependent Clp protease ATP-binding subunit ClpC